MSKGVETIAVLQRLFGGPVDPVGAINVLVSKLNAQGAMIEKLQDLLCAMAFDHGTVIGVADWCGQAEQAGDDAAIHEQLALPCCELRTESITPNQPPAVRLA